MPLTSLQPCLTNTPGSEIKLRRGAFSLDLAAGHRVTAASTGMLPGKGAGGPLLPRATRRQRGGGTRLASVGSSYPLLRRPRTCQGVSPSLSSFSSITPSNADCCMPHPCGAAALLSTPVIVSAEISRLEARGEGVSPALPPSPPLPQLRQGAASPASRLRRMGCCIGAGVARRALRPCGCRARVKPPGKRGDTKEN